MELNPRISGKCQLILIPGETRELKLGEVGVAEIQELSVEFFAANTSIPAPLTGVIIEYANPFVVKADRFYSEGKYTVFELAVPAEIDTSKPWSGRVILNGEIFCEFEVKFLDAEKAKSLGWECPSK